jgi:hypothetical protein
LPFVARTYVPWGQTPIRRAPLVWAHHSVTCAVTADGRVVTPIRMVTPIQEQAFTGETVGVFLRQLLRQIPGKLLVVRDRARIHYGRAGRAFQGAGAAARLHRERLLASAPEINRRKGSGTC